MSQAQMVQSADILPSGTPRGTLLMQSHLRGVAMYGTTMIGKMAPGVTGDKIRAELQAWEAERKPPGYMSSHVLIGDDGRTVVNVAVFESKESYLALADDPKQDEWWRTHYAPMLDGDPQWLDGEWIA